MRTAAASFLAFLLLLPSGAQAATAAQGSLSTACIGQMQDRMAQQQRVFRGVLFGDGMAADSDPGSVRHATDTSAWIKTAAGTWRSATAGHEGATYSDAQMDAVTEWTGMNEEQAGQRQPREGIVATRGVLTSQLIEPLTQSYRALSCRTRMVCGALAASLRGDQPGADGRLKISSPGCQDLYVVPLDQCRFDNAVGTENPASADPQAIDLFDEDVVHTTCYPLQEEVLAHEGEVIRLTATYHSHYTWLLQFAGAFDVFLDGFHGDILSPLEDALSLVGTLARIPCFVASCNE